MAVRVVGLLGGECTGKSTLAAALAAALPAAWVTESLREFVRDRGRPPTRHEQLDVLRMQQDAVAAGRVEAQRHGWSWVIADPSPLMTAVYSIVYFDDHSLLPAALDGHDSRDRLVALDDDIPWVPEPGVRDGPEYRRAAQEAIAVHVLPALAARRIPVYLGRPPDLAWFGS